MLLRRSQDHQALIAPNHNLPSGILYQLSSFPLHFPLPYSCFLRSPPISEFYCCITDYHPFITCIRCITCSVGQRSDWDWLGSQLRILQGWNQVSTRLGTSLEVLRKNLLPRSSSLLAESSSFQWWDWGACLLTISQGVILSSFLPVSLHFQCLSWHVRSFLGFESIFPSFNQLEKTFCC